MTTFREASERIPVPPRKTIVLREEHWASTFENRPANPIKVGLRLLSIESKDIIRQVATKAATDAIEQGVDPLIAAQSAQLTSTIAQAICHPKDVTKGHEFFTCPDDMIPIALTEQATKWLFDEIEKLTVENSPVFAEATDEEIGWLRDELANGALERLTTSDPIRAARVRRYLDFVITELEA